MRLQTEDIATRRLPGMHPPSGTRARHRTEHLRFYSAQTDHIFSPSIVLFIEHRNDVQILKPRVASLKQYVLKILTSFLSIGYGQRSLKSSRAKHEGTGRFPLLRWLDWIFLRGYLRRLSFNYVGMSKDMGKRLPQLYYIMMKISYDLGFIASGVAMATLWRHYAFYLSLCFSVPGGFWRNRLREYVPM